jgi:transposase
VLAVKGIAPETALAASGGAWVFVLARLVVPPAGLSKLLEKKRRASREMTGESSPEKRETRAMHVETLLRYTHPIKGFSYGPVRLIGERGSERLSCTLHPWKRHRPVCSVCGVAGPSYGKLPTRSFRMVPLWGIPVDLIYAMRRVSCSSCQRIVVEQVPWAYGKSPMTIAFMIFLASWAKVTTWKEVGTRFHVGWDAVYRAVSWIVEYGKKHRNLENITALGVDEIQRSHGQNYLTVVYQIDPGNRRLLWIGRGRTKKIFTPFFTWFGKERCANIRFFCTDMWKPYLDLIATHAPNAINVLDRFHLVAKLGLAVDQVRRAEMTKLRAKGKDVLVRTRWIWLKKPVNLTGKQRQHRRNILEDPVNLNLKTIKAYFFRLDLDRLWTFAIPENAGAFLDDWCRRVMRSRIKPLMAMAKSFRAHRHLILNYFHANKVFSSGVVEGLNNKAKVGMRRAYGNRSDNVLEIALFHQLGALPEPPMTHRFSG